MNNSLMNISFKSYIDIFNFISKVFSMIIINKESALYRYENLMIHDQAWPLKGDFTILRRYVMKINNLRDGNLNQYDDASVNIITYRTREDMCAEPYVVSYEPLFADRSLNINILVDTKFFNDKTFEEPNKSVVIDRVSYVKMIMDNIAKIFFNGEISEENKEILDHLNSTLAYCLFVDRLVDKDVRDLTNRILGYACAQGLDYVYITDSAKLYEVISSVYYLRPAPKLINDTEDKSLE